MKFDWTCLCVVAGALVIGCGKPSEKPAGTSAGGGPVASGGAAEKTGPTGAAPSVANKPDDAAPASGSPDPVAAGNPKTIPGVPALDSVKAVPIGEFVAGLGPDKGAFEKDPHAGKTVAVRGVILRVTPSRVGYAPYADSIPPRVWLYGETLDSAWGSEPLVACTLKDDAQAGALRPGLSVAVEGRYSQQSGGTISLAECRVIGAGEIPADAPPPRPYPSLKELKQLGERLNQFEQAGKFKVVVAEDDEKRLNADIDEKALVDGEVPADLLDALKAFPVEVVRVPGAGAKSLLAHIDAFPHVQRLRIERDGKWGPADLAALKPVKSLREIEFHFCYDISDETATALAACPQLQSVELGNASGITDAGIITLASLPALRSLSVDTAPGVTDAVLQPLSRSKHLRSLRIQNAKITGSGFAGLPKEAFPALQILSLAGSKLTEEGIDALIASGIKLRGLNVQGAGLSEETRKRLKEAQVAGRIHE